VGPGARSALRRVWLVRKKPKVRHHKPKPHQRNACPNPGKECPLLREQIPQVDRWLLSDRNIHFRELYMIGRGDPLLRDVMRPAYDDLQSLPLMA
jgi:hypothetical protein